MKQERVTDLTPLTFERDLRCDAAHAFGVWTTAVGRWWDPRYTASAETFEEVTVEPRVGGRVFASHGDLGEHDWGEVTVWEPGTRVVYAFTLAQHPAHATELAATFTPRDRAGCTFRLVHGGWTEVNADSRARFTDWPLLLDRYVAEADRPS
jgi:hypothetical protein